MLCGFGWFLEWVLPWVLVDNFVLFLFGKTSYNTFCNEYRTPYDEDGNEGIECPIANI